MLPLEKGLGGRRISLCKSSFARINSILTKNAIYCCEFKRLLVRFTEGNLLHFGDAQTVTWEIPEQLEAGTQAP